MQSSVTSQVKTGLPIFKRLKKSRSLSHMRERLDTHMLKPTWFAVTSVYLRMITMSGASRQLLQCLFQDGPGIKMPKRITITSNSDPMLPPKCSWPPTLSWADSWPICSRSPSINSPRTFTTLSCSKRLDRFVLVSDGPLRRFHSTLMLNCKC